MVFPLLSFRTSFLRLNVFLEGSSSHATRLPEPYPPRRTPSRILHYADEHRARVSLIHLALAHKYCTLCGRVFFARVVSSRGVAARRLPSVCHLSPCLPRAYSLQYPSAHIPESLRVQEGACTFSGLAHKITAPRSANAAHGGVQVGRTRARGGNHKVGRAQHLGRRDNNK